MPLTHPKCVLSILATTLAVFLPCAGSFAAATYVVHPTDFVVGSNPTFKTFPDGFTFTFQASPTVAQEPHFGNTLFPNDSIVFSNYPSTTTLTFSVPVTAFVTHAGVTTGGTGTIDFDTKAYLGATQVGESIDTVPIGFAPHFYGDFTFGTGAAFDRVVISPIAHQTGGGGGPLNFSSQDITVSTVPEPSSLITFVLALSAVALCGWRVRRTAR